LFFFFFFFFDQRSLSYYDETFNPNVSQLQFISMHPVDAP